MNKYAIAIHGGAGTILKNTMTPDKEKAYLNWLKNHMMALTKHFIFSESIFDDQ